jgi:hypothetical protein
LAAVVGRGEGQCLAARGNPSAARRQQNGSGRAAEGGGSGSKWQRFGRILAACGSAPIGGGVAAVVERGHGDFRVCVGGGLAAEVGIMQEKLQIVK